MYHHDFRGEYILLTVYVGNSLYTGSRNELLEQFEKNLAGCVDIICNHDMKQFLCLNTSYASDAIHLSAAKYAEELGKRFNITPAPLATPYRTPGPNHKPDNKSLSPAGLQTYQQQLGCLLFTSVTCRPDLSYIAGEGGVLPAGRRDGQGRAARGQQGGATGRAGRRDGQGMAVLSPQGGAMGRAGKRAASRAARRAGQGSATSGAALRAGNYVRSACTLHERPALPARCPAPPSSALPALLRCRLLLTSAARALPLLLALALLPLHSCCCRPCLAVEATAVTAVAASRRNSPCYCLYRPSCCHYNPCCCRSSPCYCSPATAPLQPCWCSYSLCYCRYSPRCCCSALLLLLSAAAAAELAAAATLLLLLPVLLPLLHALLLLALLLRAAAAAACPACNRAALPSALPCPAACYYCHLRGPSCCTHCCCYLLLLPSATATAERTAAATAAASGPAAAPKLLPLPTLPARTQPASCCCCYCCCSPPSRPAATTAAAAARATAAAGGGSTGSAGSAAGAGGAGGATGSAGGAAGAGGVTGSAGGAAGAGAAWGGHRRSLPLPDDPTPQQLCEWVLQRARPGGGGFGFLRTAQRRQQIQRETFSPQVLRELIPQRCVTGSDEAAALGASESAAALGASESAAALGARASPTTGPSSAEALHTFTLDSSASRCFFCECTTLTPLAAPVPVSMADPTRGPVVARASIVLPCPAVPSGSLMSGLIPLFLEGSVWQSVAESSKVTASSQVSASGQLAASCSYRVLSLQTLFWHHRLGHPSLPRLRSMHSRLLLSGLPRSLPSLARSSAPPYLPCVEGQQRAAPHSSEFPLTTAPLQTLHMDLRDRFCRDLPVLRLHSDRGGEFSCNLLTECCQDEGIHQTFTLLASPKQNGIAECCKGLIMEVARTSMIHAAAPHFLWPMRSDTLRISSTSSPVSQSQRPRPHSVGQDRLAMCRCFGS
ncbi:unnamed protein product [Closterium sp. NIES-54]